MTGTRPAWPPTAETLAGPWPLVVDLARPELERYLAAVAGVDPAAPTGCPGWSVRDLTVHLAATVGRFGEQLRIGRSGRLDPPFAPEELGRVNAEAVATWSGPIEAEQVRAAAAGFLDAVDRGDEPMPHQFGAIPVSLQVLFWLSELALHHHDLRRATGVDYRPPDEVVAQLLPVWSRVLNRAGAEIAGWPGILAASGR